MPAELVGPLDQLELLANSHVPADKRVTLVSRIRQLNEADTRKVSEFQHAVGELLAMHGIKQRQQWLRVLCAALGLMEEISVGENRRPGLLAREIIPKLRVLRGSKRTIEEYFEATSVMHPLLFPHAVALARCVLDKRPGVEEQIADFIRVVRAAEELPEEAR